MILCQKSEISIFHRVIVRCCAWMESQDRALYQYFSEMKVMAGSIVASETEMLVIENYLGNYLEVRLSFLN